MRKIYAIIIALGLAFGVAGAQTLTVAGSKVVDSTNTSLASGTITFAPVDLNGKPISYRMGGNGQVLSRPVTATVTNGAFSLVLPDTSLTNPVNVCFAVTVVDNVTGDSVLGPGYSCVQPSSAASSWCTSSTCNFDEFTPNNAALPLETVGAPAFTGGNVASATTFQNAINGGVNGTAWQVATTIANEFTAMTFNGNNNSASRIGFGAYVSGSPQLFLYVPTGGGFQFMRNNTPLASGCAQFGIGGSGWLDSLGQPCALYAGAYSSGATYPAGAIVTSGGSAYLSLVASNTGNAPASSPSDWQPLSGSGSTFTGGTVPNATTFTDAVTAPSFISSGSGGNGIIVPAGSMVAPPSNAIGFAAPPTVTTPYDFTPPAAPPGSTPLLLSCLSNSSGTIYLTCNWVTNAAASLDGVSFGNTAGSSYTVESWNGTYTTGNDLGLEADTSGTSKSLYIDIPSISGSFTFRVAGVNSYLFASTGTYDEVSFNNNNTDGTRLGFVAGNSYLYYDTPTGGQHTFRIDDHIVVQFDTNGINQPLTTPASSSATCATGDHQWDANYIYICTATNTWKRVALTTF